MQLKQKYTAVCRVAEDRANLIASMKGKYNEMFERKKENLNKKAMRQALSRNKIKEMADQTRHTPLTTRKNWSQARIEFAI